MSIAKFHSEWLSLLEISGPFLSLPVLVRRFPQGLETHDPDHFRILRQVLDEWEDNQQGLKPDPGIHTQWIKWVLKNTLELDDVLLEGQRIPQTIKADIEEPQNRETLRPDMVLMDPDGKKARLLIQVYPLRQQLTRVVESKSWKASPDTRMTQLLRDTGVQLGLVTNGDRWMLVYAPKGEASGYTSWYSTIWLEEQKTLAAFRNLLGLHRFFGVGDEETLEALLLESTKDQQEVTDQLGYQVRKAVEVLVQSLDKADQDYGGKLLEGVHEKVLYEASLTVMMRLVFLFCAEERDLLLLGDDIYDLNYAVSTLREQLRTTADNYGEEILERRNDAWSRLLTTFRAVYSGVQHERMKLPPYGGSLFNPDRFPFLEGREPRTKWRDTPSQPLPINNRTVLHLLEALQVLQVRLPGGGPAEPRKLSFRSLGIEQIGHVYEGLLDHTAVRATEPVLGLAGTRDNEPEFPLSKLEELAAKGEKELGEFLAKKTGRSSVATINRMLGADVDDQTANRFRTACHGNEELWKRIEPFAGLVRNDTFAYPAVIVTKSVYVTAGTDRRSSGTHYTPLELTEPIVQYTLEPLVYVGPTEGKPKSEWKLKSAKELLDLRICDMACGSGAFLVQVCRYLAARLLEAWEEIQRVSPNSVRITPEGDFSTGKPNESLIPDDPEERRLYAMRIIAQRCLYGVDINPLAVEMAKLSLWLLTMAKDKPFEFLDHNIRCGDSLVGIHNLDQLRQYNLKPASEKATLLKGDDAVNEVIALRLKIEDLPANSVDDIQRQEKLLQEANQKIAGLRCAADMLVSAEFWGENARDKAERSRHAYDVSKHHLEENSIDEFEKVAAEERRGQKMFHWSLEFPEVIVKRGGFDAFVGNPPFIGNKYWKDRLPRGFQGWAETLCSSKVGKIDVVALFYRRAFALLRPSGTTALIATTTAREGDTLGVGFGWISQHGEIYRGVSQNNWPGQAGVHYCIVWFGTSRTNLTRILNDEVVDSISPSLTNADAAPEPFYLARSLWGFKGSDNSKGMGFVLSPQSEWFGRLQAANSPFLRPYITGEDITAGTYRNPPRYVIDCMDLSLQQVKATCPETFAFLDSVVRPTRSPEQLKSYPGLSDRWWQMWNHRAEQYRELRQEDSCVAIPVVSKHVDVAVVPSGYVYTNKICVLKKPDSTALLSLLSSLYEAWVVEQGGTMRADTLTLTLEKCVQAFPLCKGKAIGPERLIAEWYRLVDAGINEWGGGFTSVFNHVSDKEDQSTTANAMRLHRSEIDKAVAAAYGWTDLDLGHGFQNTKQGLRFTISDAARREVLQRLLKLNHERYAEEEKQGLHGKKGTAKKAPRKKAASNPAKVASSLFDMEDDEPESIDTLTDQSEDEEIPTPTYRTEASNVATDEPAARPTPIDEISTDDIMAAFRQAGRGRGALERDELLKEVSVILGYKRFGPKIEEVLRGQLRAAIRRRIIEADGPSMVRAGTTTMADYDLEELRETFRSVMRKGATSEREDIIHLLARYLGFSRVTEISREAIKSAINSAIRQGLLGYEGNEIWREE